MLGGDAPPFPHALTCRQRHGGARGSLSLSLSLSEKKGGVDTPCAGAEGRGGCEAGGASTMAKPTTGSTFFPRSNVGGGFADPEGGGGVVSGGGG